MQDISESFPYADLVILALIAGFILLRLRSVLGQKGDQDSKFFFKKPPTVARTELLGRSNDKSLKVKLPEEPDTYLAGITDSPLAFSLHAIKEQDPQFSATAFLSGAKTAFEMVFDAFAKGDKPTLKPLLSDALYQHFAAEIDARAVLENKAEATLVAIESKDITEARLNKSLAHLHVRFTSEQIHIVRGPKGEIVSGDPSRVDRVIDEWQFERDVAAKNPNWKITET